MRLKGNIWNIPLKDLLTDFDSIFLTCPLIKNKNDIFKGKKIPVLSHFGERYWKRQNVPHGIIKTWFFVCLTFNHSLFFKQE